MFEVPCRNFRFGAARATQREFSQPEPLRRLRRSQFRTDSPSLPSPEYSVFESRKHPWVEIIGDDVMRD